jgi:YVTN family beta-propeller protein
LIAALVTSEVGGTASVIDAKTRRSSRPLLRDPWHQAESVAGLRARAQEGSYFVALGPANHVAVIDARNSKSSNIGQRVWQLALTPDEKLLFTTNGNSNDVSVIDVPNLKVVKSMPVGMAPWGVTISQH